MEKVQNFLIESKKKDELSLSDLKNEESGIIVEIEGKSALRIRLMELGFVEGTPVKVLNISPYKNSYLLEVRGSCLALRKSAVKIIKVAKL